MLRKMTPEEAVNYELGEIAKRAAIVFAAEEWMWFPDHVPNAIEIEETIRELLTMPDSIGDFPSGSGRLIIYSDELHGENGVAVALELGGLSGIELETL